LLLQKTMVVTEGVARSLNPDLNIWTASEPVVRQWIERKLGPLGKIEQALGTAGTLGSLALRVPRIMEEAHNVHRKLDAFVSAQTAPPNPWPTRLLAICALALVVIATRMVLR
jgi:ubiquinone biosynthesis protein